MTLEQLRIFVAVAEREHVTRAAEALNLTQSATSAAVAALENRYATRLFDRVGRRIVLTEAGKLFLAEARAVLARASSAEGVLIDLAGLARGRVALAASQTVANYWLPGLMHRFRAAYPGIELTLVIGNTETVTDLVQDGSADLGFVEGIVRDPHFAISAVARDEMVLVVSAAKADDVPRRPSAADLRRLPWVFRERGSGTRALLEAALHDLAIAPTDLDIVLELPSNEAVRTAVEAGAGAAALSRLVVAASIQAGTIVALDVALPPRGFFSLRHKEHHVTHALDAFQRLVKQATLTPEVAHS